MEIELKKNFDFTVEPFTMKPIPKNFYISDLHFGHANVLAYDGRPWVDIAKHDEALIDNWNSTVSNIDTVYILGDVIWAKEKEWPAIICKLNGKKVLVRGNHDPSQFSAVTKNLFEDIKDYKEIKDDGRNVVLSHYPIPCFNKHFYGEYHLYGHVHNSFEYGMMLHNRQLMEELYSTPCKMYNVGAMIDYMGYTPRTLDQIIKGFDETRELAGNFTTIMHSQER